MSLSNQVISHLLRRRPTRDDLELRDSQSLNSADLELHQQQHPAAEVLVVAADSVPYQRFDSTGQAKDPQKKKGQEKFDKGNKSANVHGDTKRFLGHQHRHPLPPPLSSSTNAGLVSAARGGVPHHQYPYGGAGGWVPVISDARRYRDPFAPRHQYHGANVIGMHFFTAALRALEPRIDDDFVDRLNYYYSSTMIIMFAILVSAKQYVGHPIECWVPAQFTKAMEQYAENYCWIQNTYWVPFSDLIPNRWEDRERRQIGYYQWVPFILALEALMFYIPTIIWRMMNSQSGLNTVGILHMASDEHNIEPENRIRTVNILSRYLDDSLRYQRDFGSKEKSIYLWAFIRVGKFYGAYVSLLYIFVKFLYCVNVLGQFFLLNRFLETSDYPFFGAHVLWDLINGADWQHSGKFPRVTLCDFDIRVVGNIHRHTIQCVLVINMFTEKIFICLWLWLLFLSFTDVFGLLFWTVTTIAPTLRIKFILKHLDLTDAPPDAVKDAHHIRKFVLNFLRPDGVLMLRMIANHGGTILCTELIYSLWLRYRETFKLTVERQEDDEEDGGGGSSASSSRGVPGAPTPIADKLPPPSRTPLITGLPLSMIDKKRDSAAALDAAIMMTLNPTTTPVPAAASTGVVGQQQPVLRRSQSPGTPQQLQQQLASTLEGDEDADETELQPWAKVPPMPLIGNHRPTMLNALAGGVGKGRFIPEKPNHNSGGGGTGTGSGESGGGRSPGAPRLGGDEYGSAYV